VSDPRFVWDRTCTPFDSCTNRPLLLSVRPDHRTAFRKRPYFIIMSVTIVTLPISMGFLRDGDREKPL
jgi:hypothetical protein